MCSLLLSFFSFFLSFFPFGLSFLCLLFFLSLFFFCAFFFPSVLLFVHPVLPQFNFLSFSCSHFLCVSFFLFFLFFYCLVFFLSFFFLSFTCFFQSSFHFLFVSHYSSFLFILSLSLFFPCLFLSSFFLFFHFLSFRFFLLFIPRSCLSCMSGFGAGFANVGFAWSQNCFVALLFTLSLILSTFPPSCLIFSHVLSLLCASCPGSSLFVSFLCLVRAEPQIACLCECLWPCAFLFERGFCPVAR